jgi:hypothetical protein
MANQGKSRNVSITEYLRSNDLQRWSAFRAGYEDARQGLPFSREYELHSEVHIQQSYENGRMALISIKETGDETPKFSKNSSWCPKWLSESFERSNFGENSPGQRGYKAWQVYLLKATAAESQEKISTY